MTDSEQTPVKKKSPGAQEPGDSSTASVARKKAAERSAPSPASAAKTDDQADSPSFAEDEAGARADREVAAAESRADGSAAAEASPDADGASLSDPSENGPDDASAGREAAASSGEAHLVAGDIDELAKVSAERDQYLALAQRTQADFENYRKRMARETATAETRGMVRLAKELLPALDNLERALSAAAEDDPLLAGVRLVHGEMMAALARLGIESYSPAGERFDPAEHEAMAQQAVEGAEAGTVVEVYQSGYRLNGSIIRPARVVVAA